MSLQDEVKLLKQINEMQASRIEEQEKTIEDLRIVIDELRSIKANLEETLEEFKRQIFGVRSEKTSASKATEEPKKEEAKKIHVKAHTKERKPKATRDDLYKDLPIREILCKVPDDERFCEWCNSEMVPMASTFIREEIRITPAKVERIHYMQEVLICPECKKDHDGSFKKGVAPAALIPHSPASASAVAYIMFQKCFMGLPYYRLEAAMKQLGVKSQEKPWRIGVFCLLINI